ncbi:MAG: CBS domain-containing protein [Bacteroidia bacterium]
MLLDHYISYDFVPLNPEQKIEDAIEKMEDLKLDLMPVVDSDILVNYASLEDLQSRNSSDKISTLPQFSSILPSVNSNQHLLDICSQLKTFNAPLIAVVDAEGLFQGVLETQDTIDAISSSLTIRNAGSILVIRVKPIDYSLSDLSRIIEYSDAKILGLFIYEVENSDELDIHLKLNTTVLKHILATLERYDYKVVQYFNREDLTDDLDQRYFNLMKFIDV